MHKPLRIIMFSVLVVSALLAGIPAQTSRASAGLNPNKPEKRIKLIFIHHSSGENWLTDGNGNLGLKLGQSNYFVSDTNYGWGPNSIGDRTDIPDWLEWFRSSQTPVYMKALFNENGQHSSYTRTLANPGGENQIVMFKSCFPNSALDGNPNDPPSSANPGLNVGYAKYVYNQILIYFATQPNKLFIVITAPPLVASQTTVHQAANARAFNNWLVNNWLVDNSYSRKNVAVFDFYNVLTGPNNHHYFKDGQIKHVIQAGSSNMAYYPSSSDDPHPSPTGNQKATSEFVTLLNVYYHLWAEGQTAPTLLRPSGTVATHRPSFLWGAVSSATKYHLAVWSNSAAAYAIQTDVPLSSCSSTTCTYTSPSTDLANGTYKFKVAAISSGGTSTYSSWMAFKVSSSLPLAPTLIGPSGTVTIHKPTFHWNKVSGAASYKLAVYSYASGTYPINTSIPASACGTTTCSYTATVNLANGSYKFKMAAHNSYGYSSWSPFMGFTVSAP